MSPNNVMNDGKPGRGGRDRLMGWKELALFFGKDRSTVMRWAKGRGLPIYRIPGGKQGSVYAYRWELTEWLVRQATTEDEAGPDAQDAPDRPEQADGPELPDTPAQPPAVPRARFRRRMRWIGLTTAIAFVALAAFGVGGQMGKRWAAVAHPLPNDPELHRMYVDARDAWGQRTPASLKRSIALYRRLIGKAPAFAPGYSGLADAWLAMAGQGGVSVRLARQEARRAAARSIELNDRLADGHRILGRIAYWADADPHEAIRQFRMALEYNPNDHYTHVWFANVLADLGHHPEAERHYAAARLRAPGTQAIEIGHACAQWQAGRDTLALSKLSELQRRYPTDATIRNCLAMIHLVDGRLAEGIEAMDAAARLRQAPDMMELVEQLRISLRQDPSAAWQRLVADARQRVRNGELSTHLLAALYAAVANDRQQLGDILKQAIARQERWYSRRLVSRINEKMQSDYDITTMIGQLAAPLISLD